MTTAASKLAQQGSTQKDEYDRGWADKILEVERQHMMGSAFCAHRHSELGGESLLSWWVCQRVSTLITVKCVALPTRDRYHPLGQKRVYNNRQRLHCIDKSTTQVHLLFLTISYITPIAHLLQVKKVVQNDAPSSRANKTPPIGVRNAAATPAAVPMAAKSRLRHTGHIYYNTWE